MKSINYHAVLDLEFDATIDDIKKAYKTLAKIRHPDKGGSNEAFNELKEAYEWLLINHGKPKFNYEPKSKSVDLKERNIPFQWNLFDVFNGIERSFTAKFDEKFIRINIKEPARCINYFDRPKIIHTKDTDYIVTVTNSILTTSNSSFKLERNGYDLILTVLCKTDSLYIETPLNGIKVDNKVFDLVTFDNLGLYEHTENGIKVGNLIIDNSINRREIEDREVEMNGFAGIYLIAFAIIIWLFQLIM
jgi:hypothetical protein